MVEKSTLERFTLGLLLVAIKKGAQEIRIQHRDGGSAPVDFVIDGVTVEETVMPATVAPRVLAALAEMAELPTDGPDEWVEGQIHLAVGPHRRYAFAMRCWGRGPFIGAVLRRLPHPGAAS